MSLGKQAKPLTKCQVRLSCGSAVFEDLGRIYRQIRGASRVLMIGAMIRIVYVLTRSSLSIGGPCLHPCI